MVNLKLVDGLIIETNILRVSSVNVYLPTARVFYDYEEPCKVIDYRLLMLIKTFNPSNSKINNVVTLLKCVQIFSFI